MNSVSKQAGQYNRILGAPTHLRRVQALLIIHVVVRLRARRRPAPDPTAAVSADGKGTLTVVGGVYWRRPRQDADGCGEPPPVPCDGLDVSAFPVGAREGEGEGVAWW